MKQMINIAALMVLAFFAAACQRDGLALSGSCSAVTFSVEVTESVVTKADGEGEAVAQAPEVNNLVYAVYQTSATSLKAAQAGITREDLVYQYNPKAAGESTEFFDGNAQVSIELINDQSYIILFWAQVDQTWVAGTDFDLTNIVCPDELTANSETYAAYSGVSYVAKVEGSRMESVDLKRPFAQVNIASSDPETYNVNVVSSSVVIGGAASSFNVATQEASDATKTVTFTTAVNPAGPFSQDYQHYVARNYVFANGNISVVYTINTEKHGTITNVDAPIYNVPVARNYRTNIVGHLLASDLGYNVELNDDWAGELPPLPVATVGSNEYTTLAAAAAEATAGESITVLRNVTLSEPVTIPGDVTFNGNGKQINGTLIAEGSLTFSGHTMVTALIVQNNGCTITIPEGACLEINGDEPFKAGYNNMFNIGSAEPVNSSIQTALIIDEGILIEGESGVIFNFYNTRAKLGSIISNTTSGTFHIQLFNSKMNVETNLSLLSTNSTLYLSNSTLVIGGEYINDGQLTKDQNSTIIVNNQEI